MVHTERSKDLTKENVIIMDIIKRLLRSDTIKIAIVQAIGGVLIVAFTELDMIGYAAFVKSILDVLLRAKTTRPISER